MYQRILVPIDGSPTSLQGLAEAIRLARLTGGQLRLLHMVDALSLTLGMGAYGAFSGDVYDALQKEGQKILQDGHQQALAEGIAADTAMEEGVRSRLADLVLEQVKKWPADLVVLGTHGRRGVGRMLLGSDAEQVVRTCPVPVLLVRGSDAVAPD
ncbi:universal stress protein UspA [Acidovorax sp. SRB_14]|uniref:universal stress protein n=1 Tax=Acidovorax sp. SRB_14 TaxID=1962699 RepID=UPI00146F4D24|nr:universal stress protein [Acidovorax sp. SRB_14]NMM81146.1 universal stress protein UspA [Acidovorax sp. SRB_14]NMM90310.1 universal stress protein UspA [Rhodococcus sp. SRB_17]